MPAKKTQNSKLKTQNEKTGGVANHRTSGILVPVYSLTGAKAFGNLNLPKEIFGAGVNKALLAQAVRVYLNNQTGHYSHTKTRAEVRGSTAKMGPQKGSGRARHGSKRAPIFVGGGIALGPKSRKVILEMPKKMKSLALVSALSQRALEKEIFGVVGVEKSSGKTREVADLIKKTGKAGAMLVVGGEEGKVQRAARNIPLVSVVEATQLNVLDVVAHKSLLLTKGGVSGLEARIFKEKKQ